MPLRKRVRSGGVVEFAAVFSRGFAREFMTERDREVGTVQGSQAGHATSASADLGANTAIGRKLKAFYDDVASEPVPDRFLSLLDALDRAERATKRPEGE